MTAIAKLGFGTLIKIGNGDGPPETFTTVGNIVSLKPPGKKTAVVDRTTMQSPNAVKQKLGAIKEWEKTTCKVYFDPADAGHAAVIAAISQTKDLQILFPDGHTWTFAAVIESFEPGEVTKEGLIEATFQFDVDGDVTFA